MAGPNPFRLHSFRETRAILGKSWLVCEPCRRYTPLRAHPDRDTRRTTFSCSVCGNEGKHVFDDPHKAGLQADLREKPLHHPDTVLRLRLRAKLAHMGLEQRHGKIPREHLPQAKRERAQPEPARHFTLKPLPLQIFGDLSTWGIATTIDCTRCRHQAPLEVSDNLRTLPLLTTQLRCTAIRPGTALTAAAPCGGRGALSMNASPAGIPTDAFVSVSCGAFEHTSLSVSYISVGQAPWADYLAKGDYFSCPVCRKRMAHTWHQAGGHIR